MNGAKDTLIKLNWTRTLNTTRDKINLYLCVFIDEKRHGKSIEESINSMMDDPDQIETIFISADEIKTAMKKWYDLVYESVIPFIHDLHNLELPTNLWDIIVHEYVYPQLRQMQYQMQIKVSKDSDNKNNNDNNDNNISTNEQALALDSNDIGDDDPETFEFFKQFYIKHFILELKYLTKYRRIIHFFTIYAVFKFVLDILMLVMIIAYVVTDKRNWINETSAWIRYERLFASLVVSYLMPTPLFMDFMGTVLIESNRSQIDSTKTEKKKKKKKKNYKRIKRQKITKSQCNCAKLKSLIPARREKDAALMTECPPLLEKLFIYYVYKYYLFILASLPVFFIGFFSTIVICALIIFLMFLVIMDKRKEYYKKIEMQDVAENAARQLQGKTRHRRRKKIEKSKRYKFVFYMSKIIGSLHGFMGNDVIRVLFCMFVTFLWQSIYFGAFNINSGQMWVAGSIKSAFGLNGCENNGLFLLSQGNYDWVEMIVYLNYWSI